MLTRLLKLLVDRSFSKGGFGWVEQWRYDGRSVNNMNNIWVLKNDIRGHEN